MYILFYYAENGYVSIKIWVTKTINLEVNGAGSLAQETPISGFGELSEEEHVKIQRLGLCQSMFALKPKLATHCYGMLYIDKYQTLSAQLEKFDPGS